MERQTDSPDVLALPPLVYTGGLFLGVVLQYLKPLNVLKSDAVSLFGGILIIISIILFIYAISFYKKNNTNIDPRKPTTFIIKKGPYRFSRNPIYLSMTLMYLGITALFNGIWLLFVLVPVLLIIQYGVIHREESYLEEKFGEIYIQYKRSVRRWL